MVTMKELEFAKDKILMGDRSFRHVREWAFHSPLQQCDEDGSVIRPRQIGFK
uniref:Uncharacterized protein n=1 Tax=Anguilla anguilla TaxID=7936 RepID=A0A0E9U1R5_ANGAN